MRKKNYKGRCEKRTISKCEDIKEMSCNVLMDGLSIGEYTFDFVRIKTNGDLLVRECVNRKFLTKPLTIKLLDASQLRWLRRGVTD